ncbi:MAG TPA: sugar ABC transporter substrate-binding protein [Thermotogaceae bacterium]|nr:sugar ABC transporter substrate-binding protein [Thermotogaceae bacterium]
MFKRCLLVFLVLVIACLGLAKTVQFWVTPFVSQPEKLFEPLLEEFKAETGIDVEISVISYADAVTKIQAAIAAGEAPDLVALSEGRFMPLVRFGNALEELDGLVSSDIMNRVVRPQLLDQYRQIAGGKLYVFPICFWTYLGAINVDIFEKAGVPQEFIDKMTDPNKYYTWDDLLKIGEMVTKDFDGNGKIDHWLYAYPGGENWVHPFLLWYWNAGGSPSLLDENGSPAFNIEATKKAFEFLLTLKEKGYMPPGVESLSAGDAIDMFTSGKTAWINNVWPSNSLVVWPQQFKDLNFRLVYPPVGPDNHRTTYFGSYLLGIPRQSKLKKEAWSFIEFLLKPESQKYIASKTYYSSITGDMPEEFKSDPRINMYMDVVKYAIPEPMHPAMARWKIIYNSETQAVLSGQKTPEQAAETMQRLAEQALEFYK